LRYTKLGSTDFLVSRLSFGTLTIGPLQKNYSLEFGAGLLRTAYEMGVNFFDTAELYETYKYIKSAFPNHCNVIVTGRSYAYDTETAQSSLKTFLKETGRERADIFMLHEQESEYTLKGHYEAIEFLLKQKNKGLIGALGISTHYIRAVEAAMMYPEIEVIHPIINFKGLGIADGTRDEMLAAIKKAYDAGKGIYGMKSIGGGNLLNEKERALSYILGLNCLHSVAVGMQSIDEITYNTQLFSMHEPAAALSERLKSQKRSIKTDETCILCGKCEIRCPQKAIKIIEKQVCIDESKCVYCGYCGTVCDAFAIRIF
jgi:predicted aldo/keto reductase-like oxidoreductase